MSLIDMHNGSVSFGDREIFTDASLRIGERERIGLIGRNGAGKSTLLRVLVGEQSLDAGTIQMSNQCRVALLTQDVAEIGGATVLDSVLETVPGRADLETRMKEAEYAIERCTDNDEMMALAVQISDIAEELEHFETYYGERYAARILNGLGFSQEGLTQPPQELSGGWKMRAVLAGLLFQRPDVLFLDEPTNHLDVPSVKWLGEFLKDYPASIVLICHDRDFLNANIERVITFEPEGLRQYTGNYEAYLRLREEESTLLEARARNQEKEMKDLERFVERFKAKASKARQAQSRAKKLKKMQDEMDGQRRPGSSRGLSFTFPDVPRSGRDVLMLEGVRKSFGDNHLYRGVDTLVGTGERIAIIGRNGAGKTTLLRLMAKELPLDAGEVRYGANVTLGYYAQHHSDLLSANRSVLDEVWDVDPTRGQASVRSVCGAFLFPGDDVEKTVGILSGGERARVLLARLLIKPGNLLLMDEPTNHLDLESSEALAAALETYGGTLIFVSHNTAFVNRLATKVWDIEDGQVVEYPGNLVAYERKREAMAAQAEAAAGRVQPNTSKGSKASKPSSNKTNKAKTKANSDSNSSGRHKPAANRNAGRSDRPADDGRQSKSAQTQETNTSPKARTKRERERETLERRVETLKEQVAGMAEDLADPGFFADKERFSRTMAEYGTAKSKLEELQARLVSKSAEKTANTQTSTTQDTTQPKKLPKGVMRRAPSK